jgi:hypothetical protein
MNIPLHPKLRILCYVNHYFGPSPFGQRYKSGSQRAETRKLYVERTIQAAREIGDMEEVEKIDVKVCGIENKNLVPIDIDFSYLKDPTLLIFESICHMSEHVDTYDYFINIEDDMLLTRSVLGNIIEFDSQAFINECLHPNRIEVGEGKQVFLDPMGEPREWTTQQKEYKNRIIRVAMNPHSALLIFSQEKFKYCLDNVDIKWRGSVAGGGMASAFAHFHKPFSLYRPYDDLSFHTVIHQDRHHPCWGPQPKQSRMRVITFKKMAKLFVPPILINIYKEIFCVVNKVIKKARQK